MDGLSAPGELKAEPGNHKVHLSWKKVEDAASYNLYWSTSEDVSKQSEDRITDISNTSYYHSGRTNGTTYYYAVTALDEDKHESAESPSVEATPPGPVSWTPAHAIITAFILVGIIAVGLLVPRVSDLWSWLGILVLLSAFIVVAGHGFTRRLLGCLIDGRNKMSLSRLQTVSWTVLVLSAFLAAALTRISTGVPDPLAISVPEQLWIVMGISITSLVGSPLILSRKTDQPVDPTAKNNYRANMQKQGQKVSEIDNVGGVATKSDLYKADVSDLFRGDEITDAATLDLGKVQMFYFTLALVFAYGVQIANLFGNGDSLGALPELSTGMVALLGISHAGYLANKTTPSVGAGSSES